MYVKSWKTVQMSLFQGRNRDTDIENGHADTVGEGEGGMYWEIRIDIYAHHV